MLFVPAQIRGKRLPLLLPLVLFLGAQLSSPAFAAGPVRGVGSLGFGTSAPASPRPGFGGARGDHARGYEGISGKRRDSRHRDSDFNDPAWVRRNSPPPAFATPPKQPHITPDKPPVIAPYDPLLPKPPLPGDPPPILPEGEKE